jgi:hypothetical protein
MYYARDRETAERVLLELRATRILDEPALTLPRLQRIRNEVACESAADRPRLMAWMSIRKLYDAYKVTPGRDLKPLWTEAITNTSAWSQSLRV